jgi:hypothetical protein
MSLIPFPNVPIYPGVPQLVRSANIPPAISVVLGATQNILLQAFQSGEQWGIFDSQGNKLGLVGQSGGSIAQALLSQLTGSSAPIVATDSLEFVKEMKVSGFPVEQGGFANYNKVEMPATPTVTLVCEGSEDDRTAFLNLINAAVLSTDLYSVVTPEVTYVNQSLTRYSYRRRADSGATLLIVEINCEEIRQVTASFSVSSTPINNPADPSAEPQTNSGLVQPTAPPPSVLKQLYNLFPGLPGASN